MRGSGRFGCEATHHGELSNSRTLGLIRRVPCAAAAAGAGAGPRQRDDPALVGVINQGASDTASARLSTGLAPAGLALRAWWRLLERKV